MRIFSNVELCEQLDLVNISTRIGDRTNSELEMSGIILGKTNNKNGKWIINKG